jgi:hypothetical protein
MKNEKDVASGRGLARVAMKFFSRSRKWGMPLLGVWLVLTGLLPLLRIDLPYSGTLLALLAIAAGVLILLDR